MLFSNSLNANNSSLVSVTTLPISRIMSIGDASRLVSFPVSIDLLGFLRKEFDLFIVSLSMK